MNAKLVEVVARLHHLAGMMVADGDVYEGALELLADPDWSVRMGMMVVLEEVAVRSPDLVQRVYPYVVDLLERGDADQRGDMAYLLGIIGNVNVLGPLNMLLNDKNSEVAEAAFEAVQQIQERETLEKSDWHKVSIIGQTTKATKGTEDQYSPSLIMRY